MLVCGGQTCRTRKDELLFPRPAESLTWVSPCACCGPGARGARGAQTGPALSSSLPVPVHGRHVCALCGSQARVRILRLNLTHKPPNGTGRRRDNYLQNVRTVFAHGGGDGDGGVGLIVGTSASSQLFAHPGCLLFRPVLHKVWPEEQTSVPFC